MEDPNSTLLPYILETLSRKPELCDTLDHLYRDIEHQLALEQNNQFGNVRTSVQRAVNVGQSLGILTLTSELVRVPFNFRVKGSKGPPVTAAAIKAQPTDDHSQPAIGTGNPSMHQRTGYGQKNVRPTMPNQRTAPNYGGGTPASDITVRTPPNVPMPMPVRPRMPRMPRMTRRPLSRSRARSRSTMRRRPYTRRRPKRGRSRSSGWRRRR